MNRIFLALGFMSILAGAVRAEPPALQLPAPRVGEEVAAPAPAGQTVLTLEEAQRIARSHSPTLQAAREKLEQAALIVDKAWVMMKPQLNAIGTYTHYNVGMALEMAFPNFADPSSIIFNPGLDPNVCGGNFACFDPNKLVRYDTVIQKQDTFGFVATLSQPLLLPRAFTQISNAYRAVDLARLSTDNLEDFIAYAVAAAYYGSLTTQKYVEISKKAVQTRRAHLEVTRAMAEAGTTPQINVLRAEIDLNKAEQDLKRAENGLCLALEALKLLIGQDGDFTLAVPASLEHPQDSLERLTEQALMQRRDLQLARLNLEVARTQEKDAWFRFLPNLMLSGMFRVADVKGFSDSYTSWSIGLTLSLPLYDGGMRYAAIREAESKIREAAIGIGDKERTIRSELRQLWLKLEMTEANLAKAQRAVELAREQTQLAEASFQAGASTNLEVIDAHTLLFSTEIAAATEELNRQLSLLRLQKAVRMFDPSGAAGAGGGMEGGGMGTGAAAEGGESMGGASGGASMGGAGGMSGMGGMGGM
ncbi:MAG: TolC family protein [Myxococcales bacterium]|nr:TolC family protein [Myxococcales bacterium]